MLCNCAEGCCTLVLFIVAVVVDLSVVCLGCAEFALDTYIDFLQEMSRQLVFLGVLRTIVMQ